MEKSWIDAARRVAEVDKALVEEFGFDLNENNLNYVCNGLNRSTFPKTGNWLSSRIKWHRAGLGIWDFFMESSSVPEPEEGGHIVLTRETKTHKISLRCTIMESHLQVKSEIGELSIDDVMRYSKVCGRAILFLDGMQVQIKS